MKRNLLLFVIVIVLITIYFRSYSFNHKYSLTIVYYMKCYYFRFHFGFRIDIKYSEGVYLHGLLCKMGIFWNFQLQSFLFTVWDFPDSWMYNVLFIHIYTVSRFPSSLFNIVFIALWYVMQKMKCFVSQVMFAVMFISFTFLSLFLCLVRLICITHRRTPRLVTHTFSFSNGNLAFVTGTLKWIGCLRLFIILGWVQTFAVSFILVDYKRLRSRE